MSKVRVHLCFLVAAASAVLACSIQSSVAATKGSAVTVAINVAGSDAGSIKKSLKAVSRLEVLTTAESPSIETVRSVAQADAKRFTEAIHADGFYAATVDVDVTEPDGTYRAEFAVKPGPRYRITQYQIVYTDEGNDRPTTPADLKIDTDGSSRGADILDIQQKILSALKERGYPSAVITERRAQARMDQPTAVMQFITTSGLLASFGPTVWPDDLRTRKSYLQTFVPWKQGQQFNMSKANQLRDDLINTGLFTVVDVQPGKTSADGATPVDVTLIERKPRTFAAGATYSTNIGVGGQVSWEHRNLFRHGETLSANLNVSQVSQTASLDYKSPRILHKTDLIIATSLSNETTPYDAATSDSTAELDYHLTRHLTPKAGVELFFSSSSDAFGHHKTALIGFPVGLTYSTIENVLNPTKGWDSAVSFEPYVGVSSGTIGFSQLQGTASYHWPFDPNRQWVGALWERWVQRLERAWLPFPPTSAITRVAQARCAPTAIA